MRSRGLGLSRAVIPLVSASLAVVGVFGTGVGAAVAANAGPSGAGRGHPVLYVSPKATSAAGTGCATAAYRTITGAIHAAPNGATVVVCPGVYREQVVIPKPLTLQGRNATIDEKGVAPRYVVPPPVGPLRIFAGVVIVSSGVSVSGFTVQHALGEGILAATVPPNRPTAYVSISGNRVVDNDLGGGNPPASTYFECQPAGEIPGDCGEGVHLIGVAYSRIANNFVSGNSGGILLTDETGPTHDNVVVGNDVTRNQFDCGITVPGHNPAALSQSGQRQPNVAGVYRNSIIGNTITDNGHLGEGAGVLFANASGGTAVYDNLVLGNYIAGNQLAGVTMHAHLLNPQDPDSARGEDLNGNRIVGNTIGTNMVPGAFVHGDDEDGVVTVSATTGVLVWAGPVKVHVTIAYNRIANDHFGLWLGLTANVVANRYGNVYSHVAVPVRLFG